ncbi:MAG: LysR family transcriptional regulator [Pseudomonadota bacterium]
MEWFKLNLRHLRILALVHRTQSLSEAARQAHVTQPAASQALFQLEAGLDCSFFERRPDGVTSTAFAESFAPRIETALEALQSPNITMAQMRALIAFADEGSYLGASKVLGVSSPSLNRAIRDLTIVLGEPLLARRGRGMTLTAQGRTHTRQFRLARSELIAGLTELQNIKGKEVGRIAIGAMPLSRARVLPAAICRFRARHPQVEIAVHEGSYAELIEPLRDSALDVIIGALRPEATADLSQTLVFEDHPVILAGAHHPILQSDAVSLPELADYEWALPPQGTPLRKQCCAFFESEGLPPPSVPIESGSVLLIRELLRQSDLLTLLSKDQVSVELEASWLKVVRTLPHTFVRRIGVTTRAGWRPTPLQTAFIDLLYDP